MKKDYLKDLLKEVKKSKISVKKAPFSLYNPLDILYLTRTLALFAALALSLISIMGLCTEACKKGLTYMLWGIHFEPIGIALFSIAFLCSIFSRTRPLLRLFTAYLIFGALGGEIILLYVQKYLIRHWCPVCLAIAGSVSVAALALTVESFIHFTHSAKEDFMKNLLKGISTFAATFAGFFILFTGISKEDQLAAAETNIQQQLAFGNQNSNLEIYLFTDWFCPACRELENSLEKIAPEILEQASLTFVDLPMHPESLNYTPYNLSFLINNKEQYFKLRQLLEDVAETTRTPTDEQITTAIATIGVNYKQLSYAEIALGVRYFRKLAQQFQIDSTPTMAILNREQKRGTKLTGKDQITDANIKKVLDNLQSPPSL